MLREEATPSAANELPTAVEKGFEASFAIRANEDIVLFNLHHGQPSSLGIDSVAVPGELLRSFPVSPYNIFWSA